MAARHAQDQETAAAIGGLRQQSALHRRALAGRAGAARVLAARRPRGDGRLQRAGERRAAGPAVAVADARGHAAACIRRTLC